MKLCYQVATPDVAVSSSVTAYQGSLQKTFGDLAKLGYDGVELMTLDPGKLNWNEVRDTAKQHKLHVGMVCTGEIFGQLGLSFTDLDAAVRGMAVNRVKDIIDFAAFLHAKVNIGRVRGQYRPDVPREQTEAWAIEAFRAICDYAMPKDVEIALESVTILQTNFVNTLAEAKGMIDLIDRDNFRLMIDVFHINIEEKDLLEAIRKYSPYNIYVHLSDNNRRFPGNCGLNFERIIQSFSDCGYDGVFCIEILQIPSMEQSARESISHLAPILHRVYNRPL